tara:strand:+ start:911 stop:1318 length:408 start_codon:yes stop_codon:yes gene_type:complete
MYKVLIPTDGSDNAKHALKYALNLLEGREVEFVLFQSFDVPVSTTDMPVSFDSLGHEELNKLLEKDAEGLRKSYVNSNFSFSTRVEIGSFSFNVNALVDELAIDLIVMGQKALQGWQRWLLAAIQPMSFRLYLVR